MKTFIYSLALVLIFSSALFSQTPSWHVLPNAPIGSSRYEDVFFANPTTGWVINILGPVYKTTDGGHNWDTLTTFLHLLLRSAGFFDTQTGIIGTLDSNHILYRTTNGGTNWTEITNISNPKPKGICGISIVNSQTAYACGRYSSPGNIIKTTDAGLTWTSFILPSYVFCLVDCYFWSPDSGIAVGGFENQVTSGPMVLLTTNGGIVWDSVHTSTSGNYCWKISFISRNIGYVSTENFSTLTHYFKTTNGGLNWVDKSFMVYDAQGIGFANENTGWIGGWGDGQNGPTYETTDAGLSWHLAGFGSLINRFRFLSDTLAYAVGQSVYKYTSEPIGIQPISTEIPKQFSLEQNYPNPFNPTTKIRFNIAPPLGANGAPLPLTGGDVTALAGTVGVKLIVYDILGKEVATLVNEQLNPGTYRVSWDASNFPSGVYFYRLQVEPSARSERSDGFSESKKMLLIK